LKQIEKDRLRIRDNGAHLAEQIERILFVLLCSRIDRVKRNKDLVPFREQIAHRLKDTDVRLSPDDDHLFAIVPLYAFFHFGHASLVEVLEYTYYRTLARTRDDAPGEAFDKIARSIGLGYPGGPLIEQASEGGRSDAFYLPVTHFPDSYDFSFSGVKTAAINVYRKLEREADREGRRWPSSCSEADFAATFQSSIVEALVAHTETALLDMGYKTLVLGGGVSANRKLREAMEEMTTSAGVRLIVPPPVYCTDNAAMIASAGYYAWRDGRRAALDLNAVPMAELDDIIGQPAVERGTER
jgi:tRNA A37 threonylcarbamoyltransferase TsaD